VRPAAPGCCSLMSPNRPLANPSGIPHFLPTNPIPGTLLLLARARPRDSVAVPWASLPEGAAIFRRHSPDARHSRGAGHAQLGGLSRAQMGRREQGNLPPTAAGSFECHAGKGGEFPKGLREDLNWTREPQKCPYPCTRVQSGSNLLSRVSPGHGVGETW